MVDPCNVLLVSPKFPVSTFWNIKATCRVDGARHASIPLGLLTVAALLPADWTCRLIDRNVGDVTEADIDWADMVMTGGMNVQRSDCLNVISLAQGRGKAVVVGGPDVTSEPGFYEHADFRVVGEAEVVIQDFIAAWRSGQRSGTFTAEKFKVDVTKTPVPRFDLLDIGSYFSMMLQFSRGCPFNCEFCDIIEMFGRKPRTKTPDQFIGELQAVYDTGFRGSLFVVDDNFIGNKTEVRRLLPRMIEWQRERGYPFMFFTEASVNLADDRALMDEMVRAGFDMVFLGIETPVEATLHQTQKAQNTRKKLMESVRAIQNTGIEVSAGFIIGFDTDPSNIFDLQIKFIQESGILMSMIGLMMALPGTQLYRRLEREGRLLAESSGNNTHDLDINFRTVMDPETIVAGYRRVLRTIYDPKKYFERCLVTMEQVPWRERPRRPLSRQEVRAFLTSLAVQTLSSYGHRYLAFLWRAFRMDPAGFPGAVRMAIREHHFYLITKSVVGRPGRAVRRAFAAAKRNIAAAPVSGAAYAGRKG